MNNNYKITIKVGGKVVESNKVLENTAVEDDGRTTSRFVRGSGIPEEFFEDDEELYSRELYVGGDEVDEENLPSETEKSYFFEKVEDYDKNVNFKSCIPKIDHDKKTVVFEF